jgi:hypothetical protein
MSAPTLSKYVKEKLKLLKEFHIKLTTRELDYLSSLTTEASVDNYIHTIFKNKL